jgi:hypothetical protein
VCSSLVHESTSRVSAAGSRVRINVGPRTGFTAQFIRRVIGGLEFNIHAKAISSTSREARASAAERAQLVLAANPPHLGRACGWP